MNSTKKSKFYLHDGIFKHWFIMLRVINDFQKNRNQLYPKKEFYDTYVNYILIQTSEEEMIKATKELASKFRSLPEWYWEYATETKSFSEGERFIWLYNGVKKLLEKEDADTKDFYMKRLDQDFLNLISGDGLFD